MANNKALILGIHTAILGIIFLLLTLLFPKNTSASVGFVNLRSTNSEEYRCYASSLVMANNKFDVAINCVNLLFPINPPQASFYMVWANVTGGKAPLKLGDLGKGIARFEVSQPFASLFVTSEANVQVRTPSKNTVMTGGVEEISFLRRPTSPTPTPTPVVEKDEGDNKTTSNSTNTANLSTREKLLLALRRAGIAAIIALIAIVGLIFVVTRSRG